MIRICGFNYRPDKVIRLGPAFGYAGCAGVWRYGALMNRGFRVCREVIGRGFIDFCEKHVHSRHCTWARLPEDEACCEPCGTQGFRVVSSELSVSSILAAVCTNGGMWVP